MKLTYGVADKPKMGQVIVFALQQLLAILAATIAVPAIIGNDMSASAALFGAGVGTIVYLLFTKFKSPVFLGSSFAFIGSMFAAFGGAASAAIGYAGIILGAVFAGLVYVVIAIIVKAVGVKWINKLMPAVVIGPTVAIIGLSLAGNAVGDVLGNSHGTASTYVCIICGLVTLFVTMLCSVFGKRMLKMIIEAVIPYSLECFMRLSSFGLYPYTQGNIQEERIISLYCLFLCYYAHIWIRKMLCTTAITLPVTTASSGLLIIRNWNSMRR